MIIISMVFRRTPNSVLILKPRDTQCTCVTWSTADDFVHVLLASLHIAGVLHQNMTVSDKKPETTLAGEFSEGSMWFPAIGSGLLFLVAH